jgi:hypothetical protein
VYLHVMGLELEKKRCLGPALCLEWVWLRVLSFALASVPAIDCHRDSFSNLARYSSEVIAFGDVLRLLSRSALVTFRAWHLWCTGWGRHSLAPCPAVPAPQQQWLQKCLVWSLVAASLLDSKAMEVVLGRDQHCPTCDEEDEMLVAWSVPVEDSSR